MEVIQKKFRKKYTFTFHEQYLNYAYQESTGYGDLDVSYADIPKKYSVKIQESVFVALIGVVCFIQFFYYVITDSPMISKVFFFAASMICGMISQSLRTKYSIFQTVNGNVFVVQDSVHDEIVAELTKRRKAQLSEVYGQFNPENDLQAEIQKFRWLAEQDVITKEESEKKIAEAELLKEEAYDLPGEKLN